MSYKMTLILLAILVAIGGAVYWEELRPGSQDDEAAKATQVFKIDSKDINGLDISYEGKTVALRKEGETDWKLTSPEEADADHWSVEGVVARLGALNANRVLTGTVEAPSAYGLEKPIAEAKIRTTEGKTQIMMVGDKTPDGTAYYVKRGDTDSVYLVSTSMISDVVNLVTNPPKAQPTPTAAPPTTTPLAPTPTPATGS